MGKIPKILHYIFGMTPDFGGKPWSLIHHVCVKSAVLRIKPEQVFLYYEYEPYGPWWELSKQFLTLIKIKAPTEIFGNPIVHSAHRAGVVRLQTLLREGGIYLDADVLVQKSFDSLLNESTVLGQQDIDGKNGIADAVILAEPQAMFLQRWYEAYKTFRSKGRDEFWAEHAVFTAPRIAKQYPNEVTILPYNAFYWPLWMDEHIKWIFASDSPIDLKDTYANHLWETMSWPYVQDLTPRTVREISTNFHQWARPFVCELPDDFGISPQNFDVRQFSREYFSSVRPHMLEIGAGTEKKEGWLATDLFQYQDPAGDAHILGLDASKPFPFMDACFDYVFSEHMIEHIPLIDGVAMLKECFRVLRPGGTIRIVTPSIGMLMKIISSDRNVFETSYVTWAFNAFSKHQPIATPAVVFNNFVRDWGHQFIYDHQTLQAALHGAGFESIHECHINQSEHASLKNLEKTSRLPPGFLEFESMIFEARKRGIEELGMGVSA